MKYISRIDSGNTHCYWVRIGYGIKEKVQKTFPDLRHGGSIKAYKAAVKWRNAQLKKLKPVMAKAYNYDVNDQRYWGQDWREAWDTKNGWQYLSIRTQYYDGKRGKQVAKQFSVNKWGYDEAVRMATEWRQLKLTGEL